MDSLGENRRLGKGLGSLIPTGIDEKEYIKEIETDKIIPNPTQPRKKFDEEKINELADSIKENGIIQPIIVRENGEFYEIIAGERRYKAACKVGLKKIPVIVKKLEDNKSLEIALIENIQREDLNPLEEANAYKILLEKYNYTQDELAQRLGKNRATITNIMRLLKLPDKIKEDIVEGKISSGHARAILAIDNEKDQIEIAEKVIKESLSVREVESIVKEKKEEKTKIKIETKKKVEIIEIENKLKDYLGTKVKIKEGNNKGKIEIEYYSNGDLERIVESIFGKI